ncbi:MAG: Gfo/Idh/MocA family oxidoreductase [Pseudomonadota bacterium]|nr:Gfo/Idh/MocA family oxidoreductase [Pseudomonadota bacterium]
MKIAFVGCGYVADYYVQTLPNHGSLELAGVWDSNTETLNRYAKYWSVRQYRNFRELLADPEPEIVVNLTNPDSHYEITAACLSAGKHVYSEKPVSMELGQAKELVELAKSQGLCLTSAPCTLLSETAQTVWRALRDNAVGKVRLVYAQLEDGMIIYDNFQNWFNESGSPWPWKDEFETGCVVEHAGYYLTWLVACFGPVAAVDAIGSVLIPDKATGAPLATNMPDYVLANLHFDYGVVARLTCSIVAPVDRSLTIFGEEGELHVKDCWDNGANVYIRKPPIRGRYKKIRLVRKSRVKHRCQGPHNIDFSRGVAELAEAIRVGRDCHLPTDLSLHVNEISLAIRNPDEMSYPYKMTTSCAPVTPMSWACR